MAKQKLFTAAQIRAALYAERTLMFHYRSAHREAFGKNHASMGLYGSTKACGECHVCHFCSGVIAGINHAIRKFGGRPR